jgi:hypothetical protein
MPIENLTDAELARLEACKSDDDWNQACLDVKKAHGGGYPSDWYAKVIATGLVKRVAESWGGSADISLVTIDKDGKRTTVARVPAK